MIKRLSAVDLHRTEESFESFLLIFKFITLLLTKSTNFNTTYKHQIGMQTWYNASIVPPSPRHEIINIMTCTKYLPGRDLCENVNVQISRILQ